MDVLTGLTTFIADLGPVLQAGLGVYLLRRGRRLRRRVMRGLDGTCAGCGYDITGLEAGRCPECGAVVRPPLRAPPAGPA